MQSLVNGTPNAVNSLAVDRLQLPVYADDVETFADRLRLVMELRDVDQRRFAEEAGLSMSYVSSYLFRAKANPDARFRPEYLKALAKRWDVDEQWLATGVGPRPADAPARREVVVERDPSPPADNRELHPIQRALGAAFDAGRHTIVDMRRVDDLMASTSFDMELEDVDLVSVARQWLDAAATLRREGVAFSAQSMLLRLAIASNAPAAVQASEARAGEQLAALDAMVPRTAMDAPVRGAPGGGARGRKGQG